MRIFYCQIIRKWYQIRSVVGAEKLIKMVIFKIFVLSKSLSGKKRGSWSPPTAPKYYTRLLIPSIVDVLKELKLK